MSAKIDSSIYRSLDSPTIIKQPVFSFWYGLCSVVYGLILQNMFKSKFVSQAAPAFAILGASYYGMTFFTTTMVEHRSARKNLMSYEEAEQKFGVSLAPKEENTAEHFYENEVKKLALDDWENVRGPRPWEPQTLEENQRRKQQASEKKLDGSSKDSIPQSTVTLTDSLVEAQLSENLVESQLNSTSLKNTVPAVNAPTWTLYIHSRGLGANLSNFYRVKYAKSTENCFVFLRWRFIFSYELFENVKIDLFSYFCPLAKNCHEICHRF